MDTGFRLVDTSGSALDVFCARYPFNSSWNAPYQRLLYELCSSKDGILEVQDAAGQTVLVGAIVDTTQNLLGSVMVEILGVLPGTPALVLELCWLRMEEVARRAGRRAIEIYTPDHAPEWGIRTQKQGFIQDHQSLTLERSPELLMAPSVPRGLRWASLQPSQILPYFRLVEAAFAGDPGMQMTEIGSFEKAAFSRSIPIRVLWHRERPIALACVSISEDKGMKIGNMDTLARHPDWRGKRVGELVMREASRLLIQAGCDVFRLGVTAGNAPAVRLYTRYGFQKVSSWTSWVKRLV